MEKFKKYGNTVGRFSVFLPITKTEDSGVIIKR